MRASRLRHLVDIQRNSPLPAVELNEPVANWLTIASVWAEITPIAGREFFNAAQVMSDISHRIALRFFPLRVSDRISWLDRQPTGPVQHYFDIKAILDDDMKHYRLTLMCTEHGV